MYTVRCDNELLLSRFVQGRNLIDSMLHLKANVAGSLEFSIQNTHPAFNSIQPLSSRVKVHKNGVLYWLGRPRTIEEEGKNVYGVVCEGCLSFLNDSQIPPYDFAGSPEEFFQFVVNTHNSLVSDSQKFVVGQCTVTDPNDYIRRSSSGYDSAFDVLKNKLLNSFGGYLYVTYNANEEPVLNYYDDVPNTSTQLIKIGENLISYEKRFIYDDMYTACIPLGYKDEDTGKRLDIASVNDGNVYLVNETLAAQYGVRFAPTSATTWEDVILPANLKVKGQDWLDNVGIKYKESVTLNAVDISAIKQGVSSFDFLWKVGFKLRSDEPVYYVLTQLDIDLNQSANVEVGLGEVKDVYTGLIKEQVGSVASQVSVIESDYTTYQQSQQVAETVIETTTQIQTQANAIISQVLEAYYTKQQVDDKLAEDVLSLKSQIEQLSDRVTTSFTYYQTLDNQVTQIQSWVTIIPETPTQSGGIIIGNSASSIKLKLENDILYFYIGDDTAPVILMWQDSETLHIDKVEIQRLSVGVTGKMVDFRIIGSGINTCVFFSGRLVL